MPDISNAQFLDLPSKRKLIRSTYTALIVALVLLFTVVLPSEYGIDPTRIGRLLGLTDMGKIKMSLAEEAARAGDVPPTTSPEIAPGTAERVTREDARTFVLAPNDGIEVKLPMRRGDRVTYSWSTDRGVVNHDMHGEGASASEFTSYKKASGVNSDAGQLSAAFDGTHGWYWRNRGDETVTITLQASGNFGEIKEIR